MIKQHGIKGGWTVGEAVTKSNEKSSKANSASPQSAKLSESSCAKCNGGPTDVRLAGNFAIQQLLKSGAIRAKLTIGSAGDADELEADRVADQVLSSARLGRDQRKCSACAEGGGCSACDETGGIQAKFRSGQTAQISANAGAKIEALQGGGQPLSSTERSFFEPRFGRDFGNVRVHTDEQAAESATAIQARAYTWHQNIVFAAGEYAPASSEGQRLLAHELAHVAQAGPTIRRQPVANVQPTKGPTTPPSIGSPPPAKSQAIDPVAVKVSGSVIVSGIGFQNVSMVVSVLEPHTLDERRAIRAYVHEQTNVWLERWLVGRINRAGSITLLSLVTPVALPTGALKAGTETAEQGLRLLWRALPLIDRLEIYNEGYREIETAQLDVIRAASQTERDEAQAQATRPRLESVLALMNPREEYEARGLLDTSPAGRLRTAERMLERWARDPLYDAVLDLEEWRRNQFFLDHYRQLHHLLFLSLAPDRPDRVLNLFKTLSRGRDVEALIARLRLATEDRSDDQAGITSVVDRVVNLLSERRELQAAINAQGLTGPALEEARRRLNQLAELDQLLKFERPTGAALTAGSFMALLSAGRNDPASFAADAQRLAAFARNPKEARSFAFEIAKQRILKAGANQGEIKRAVLYLRAPRLETRKGQPPPSPYAQQAADEELRRELLRDEAVKAVVSRLKGSEQRPVYWMIEADRFSELLWQFNEANQNGRWGELFHTTFIIAQNEGWKARLRARQHEALGAFDAYGQLHGRPREIVDKILADPKRLPFVDILAYVSDVDQLRAVFDDIGERDRAQLRLGWFLTEHPRIGPPTEDEVKAIELYQTVKSHLQDSQTTLGVLDPSGYQTIIEVALGSEPTAEELESPTERYRAALLWYDLQQSRLGLDRGMSAGFTETDETMVGAAREYSALWLHVRDRGALSTIDFYALANLHRRFETRAGEFKAASDAIGELAATIAATVAGIIVVVATGGAATPGVIALAAVAGGSARIVTREMFGGDYYAAMSDAGARDTLLGAVDGALAVVSGRLAAKGTQLLGFSGETLTSGAAKLAGEVTEEAASKSLGRRVSGKSVEAALDGLFSGSVSEAFGTMTDARTWRRGIMDGLARVGEAALLGGLTGLGGGAVIGSAMSAFTPRGRWLAQSMAGRSLGESLERAGLIDTLEEARELARLGKVDEVNKLAAKLESHLTEQEVMALRRQLGEELRTALPRPPGTVAASSDAQKDLLAQSSAMRAPSGDHLKAETDIVTRSRPQPSREPGFVDEVDLGNGHTWRRRDDGTWCRFTEKTLCGTAIPNAAPLPESARVTAEAAKTQATAKATGEPAEAPPHVTPQGSGVAPHGTPQPGGSAPLTLDELNRQAVPLRKQRADLAEDLSNAEHRVQDVREKIDNLEKLRAERGLPPKPDAFKDELEKARKAAAAQLRKLEQIAGKLAEVESEIQRLTPTSPSRPTWRQSEIDVGSDLGPKFREQQSYLNHKPVPAGTEGSVRPDWAAIDGSVSVEVKNYDLSDINGVIDNVSSQAIYRTEHLPVGMRQQVVIDIRGQVVAVEKQNAIVKGIVRRSKGAFRPEDIKFKE